MLGHCFLKCKLARDMTYDRQQLLWQKQVTIIGSIKRGSHINEYHTGVAQFQHAISHRRSVQRQPFAPVSLFFVAPDAYSQSFSEFFSVANVLNSFSSLKRIKMTSFGNSFEQKSLTWRFVSISCPEGVSLNTSNHGRGGKMICTTPDSYLMCLNNRFVAGLIGLVPAHLSQSHSLQSLCARLVCRCCAFSLCDFL